MVVFEINNKKTTKNKPGGINTNKTGLKYERDTLLRSHYTIISSHNTHDVIQFINNTSLFLDKISQLFNL